MEPSTLTGYRRVVFKYLGDWLDCRTTDISDDTMTDKHMEIQKASGAAQASLSFRVFKALWSYASGRHGLQSRNVGKILTYSGIRQKQPRKSTVIPEAGIPPQVARTIPLLCVAMTDPELSRLTALMSPSGMVEIPRLQAKGKFV
ncbi:hypothetical protein ABH19_06535 [Leptospirillum sp. Group II 'CF-1']|nr:hypothetical protein ABH19_06535 [Leptospirillum sp. Group II 'CF-1']